MRNKKFIIVELSSVINENMTRFVVLFPFPVQRRGMPVLVTEKMLKYRSCVWFQKIGEQGEGKKGKN